MISGIVKSVLSQLPRENLQGDQLSRLLARLDESERRELARTEAIPLCLALLLAFDGIPVQILWESESGWEKPARTKTPGDEQPLRTDSPHPDVPAPHLSGAPSTLFDFEFLPVDRGVYQLEGLLAAREKRNEEYWIVAVLRTSQSEMPGYLRELVQRHPGLLIVQRHPAPTDSPASSRPGWLDGNDLAGLARLLREINRQGDSRLLPVLVSPDETLLLTGTPRTEESEPGKEEALLQEELRRLAADDGDTAVIDLNRVTYPSLKPGEVTREQRQRLDQALGLIHGGCRPVLALDEATLRKNFDQLVQDFCQPGHPVTLVLRQPQRLTEAASVPTLGLLQLLPRTRVVVPRHTGELRSMLRLASREPSPVAIWLPPQLEQTDEPIGHDDLEQLRQGRDVALVASGPLVTVALESADILEKEGIDCAVINLRCLQPLDTRRLTELSRQFAHWIVVEPASTDVRGSLWSLLVPELSATRATSRVWRFEAAFPLPRAVEIARFVRSTLSQTTPFETLDFEVRQLDHSRTWLPEKFGFSATHIERELEEIRLLELSPQIKEWHAVYRTAGVRREFLWRWAWHGVNITTLPCVPPEWRDPINQIKVLGIMINVLFDDLADRGGEEQFLELLLRLIRLDHKRDSLPRPPNLSDDQNRYIQAVWRLWSDYLKQVRRLPNFSSYRRLLQFDLDQFFNVIRYSHMINQNPDLATLEEHDCYMPHNMMMVSFSTLDLMCSPELPRQELRYLRQAMFHAQSMGRIGNLLSTWERELRDQDFSSAVFIRAMLQGNISLEELTSCNAADVPRLINLPRHQQFFFTRWQQHLESLKECARRIASFDLGPAIQGHERFLGIHLGSVHLI